MSADETSASERKPLPSMLSYSWITLDGTLDDPETLSEIFYYLEWAKGEVNVKIGGTVISFYPGDTRTEAVINRRHSDASIKALRKMFEAPERRKHDLGHAPTPVHLPDESQ